VGTQQRFVIPLTEVTDADEPRVGPDRHDKAREVLDTGRISWRLRDNDNLLLARVESQLSRAVHVAAERLKRAGGLEQQVVASEKGATVLIGALRDSSGGVIMLPPGRSA